MEDFTFYGCWRTGYVKDDETGFSNWQFVLVMEEHSYINGSSYTSTPYFWETSLTFTY